MASAKRSIPGSGGISITLRLVSQLKFNPRNPRNHSLRQIEQIAASLLVFGFLVPVLVDKDLRVIAGHGRVLAARHLGLTEVPTICITHLTEAQVQAFMIADNQLAQNATWNDRLLAEQLKELSLLDLNFNVEVTGFDIGEIDLRIASLTDETAAEEPAETPAEARSALPVCRPGDVWRLGDHRVLCGSVLDRVALERLMGSQRAAMVFCSPPFATTPIDCYQGETSPSAYPVFLARSLGKQAAFCVVGSLLYVCTDWRHLGELLAASREIKAELVNLCVWAKDKSRRGSLYRSQHELIGVFQTGGEPHRENAQLPASRKERSDVWRYPSATSGNTRARSGSTMHPTVKPVGLVADAILDCTAPGDLVLDGFLGSGATILAAERTGRRCFGTEPDPRSIDTVIRRWQRLSEEAAVNLDNGRHFEELEREAEVGHGR